MSQELKQYIKETLSKGSSNEEILQTLTSSGCSEVVVLKTLEQFTGIDSHQVPIPAPRMQAHQLAKDLFYYVLILVTLSISALGAGSLLFNIINNALPDSAPHGYFESSSDSSILWSCSQVIVSFPIYSYLTYLIKKEISKNPQKRESFIRKISIYSILALTAVIALSDLVFVLNAFLSGSMSTRFILQSLVIIGIA